ncbi:D-alanyl-D-alanine carboxypeptidase/D-alanyl-D-alanine-endopeptidase [Pseudanabaena sp. PCC 6802]|uniref:D-alanyl-D-alanine carboxypeptidase/D-alanyl-D-alanine endopeptidase n=1 Tax=Pseudanabaena sp. PCC 6802 TaxID=118173 RepID=UPI00034B5038|nr:D-alanyl-D-alanine carboxypeptidase/D-alanyl-D-alanine-endopeptidase [Pseudanabaena sp. PCC 6802]
MSKFAISIWQCRVLLAAIASLATLAIYLPGRDGGAIAQAQSDRSHAVCASQLESEVNKIILTPKLKSSRLGVLVTGMSPSSQTLVNVDGDKYFIPASNVKLLATAAALKLLGANYRIRTSLVARYAVSPKGELNGGLGVVGRGDPSLTTDTLKLLVQQLKQKGVRRINGGIYALPQFRGSGWGVGWEWQDLQEDYAAIVHPLTIDRNVLDWTIKPGQVGQPVSFSWDSPDLASGWIVENQARTAAKGSPYTLKVERPFNSQKLIIRGQIPWDSEAELGATAVPDPSSHFLKLLNAELIAQGIQVDDGLETSTKITGEPSLELASVESPTVAALIRTTNKDSNNLYAELLMRQLGQRSPQVGKDTSEAGIQAIVAFLQQQGIPSDSFNLADAAGLSRRNSITPRALTQILQIMGRDPVFRDSLSIAGIDGTLKNRFQDTPALGNLSAKTGTLSDTVSLSGYAKPAMYDELVFSIMLNQSNLEAKDARAIVDAIALVLMRVQRC